MVEVPPADAAPRLEHDHASPGSADRIGRVQTGEPGADDRDVANPRSVPLRRRLLLRASSAVNPAAESRRRGGAHTARDQLTTRTPLLSTTADRKPSSSAQLPPPPPPSPPYARSSGPASSSQVVPLTGAPESIQSVSTRVMASYPSPAMLQGHTAFSAR
jgi:hypothetical protein